MDVNGVNSPGSGICTNWHEIASPTLTWLRGHTLDSCVARLELQLTPYAAPTWDQGLWYVCELRSAKLFLRETLKGLKDVMSEVSRSRFCLWRFSCGSLPDFSKKRATSIPLRILLKTRLKYSACLLKFYSGDKKRGGGEWLFCFDKRMHPILRQGHPIFTL